MSLKHRRDIVVDANVMRLYGKAKDLEIVSLFHWIREKGILTLNQTLITQYAATGNRLVMVLLNELTRDSRLHRVARQALESFTKDRHFNYTCNQPDVIHARTVFLSYRKRCISFDKKLRNDINGFRKVDGRQPCACRHPDTCCLC